MPPSNRAKSTPPQVREVVDPRRLPDRGVVLPEDEHRVGISANGGESERGTPLPSARTGVDPVVSTAIPRTLEATSRPATASAS